MILVSSWFSFLLHSFFSSKPLKRVAECGILNERKNGQKPFLAAKMYVSAKRGCVFLPICYTFPAVKRKGEDDMQQKKNNSSKAYIIAFIAMGVVVVLYSLIFIVII